MSILIIGDLHIKVSNTRQTNIAQNDIMEILTKEKIAFVVILGDTLDNHEKIDMECLNRAADLFEMIMSTGIPLFVLIGNHDRANNRVYMTNRHPFRGFDGRPGIVIIWKCYVFDMPLKMIGVDSNSIMKFCFVPFIPDGMYMQALSDCGINPKDITMFFSHSEFKGCKINKLSKSKCDEWPSDFPLNISGHIHDEEIVQDNLIYVGTPFQHTYSDSADKGIFLMNLTTGDYKLEKIKLRVPPKVIIPVHYTQLDRVNLDPNCDVRLDIYGPTTYVKEIMNRPDMVAKFAGINKKFKDEAGTKTSAEVASTFTATQVVQFHEQLMLKISSDEKMQVVFRNIFGNNIKK